MSMIKIYCGPMFSGKTTRLIKEYNNNIKNSIIFRPDYDTRTKNLHSRDGLEAPSYKIKTVSDLDNILNSYKDINLLLFDEMQFFNNDDFSCNLIKYILSLKRRNISSSFFGLDYDWKGNFFDMSRKLIDISDKQYNLTAICKCKKQATFTMKKTISNSIFDIGDHLYEPTCSTCFKVPEK